MAHLGPATSYKYCPQPRTPHFDEQLAGARRPVRSAGPASRHRLRRSGHRSPLSLTCQCHRTVTSAVLRRRLVVVGSRFCCRFSPQNVLAAQSIYSYSLTLAPACISESHSIPSPSRLSLLAPDAGARLSHRSQSRARPTSLRTGNTVAFHPSRSDRFCACWC